MSQSFFLAELQSADPVERQLARKAVRILNDRSLDRSRREVLVRQIQRELLSHQHIRDARRQVSELVAALTLPERCRIQTVQVQGGQIEVGVIKAKLGFHWIQLGAAPAGVQELKPFSVTMPVGHREARTSPGRADRPILARQAANRDV